MICLLLPVIFGCANSYQPTPVPVTSPQTAAVDTSPTYATSGPIPDDIDVVEDEDISQPESIDNGNEKNDESELPNGTLLLRKYLVSRRQMRLGSYFKITTLIGSGRKSLTA